MIMHRHRKTGESEIHGFRGPVSIDEEPMAHGGVRITERCKCGAVRHINSNGNYLEKGEWYQPEEQS